MKVTKKVLSVFLAVLMAFSCLTATLPTIAGAAANAGQWNTLRNAVTAAGSDLNTGNFSVGGNASSTTRTITDNTTSGAIWNVTAALYTIINAEMGKASGSSYNYPTELNSRMDSVLASNLGSVYSGSVKTALDKLVDTIVNNSNFSYTRRNQFNQEQEGGYPAGPSAPAAVNITVTRSRDNAILGYDSIDQVPANVETSYRITVSSNVYRKDTTRKEDGGACSSDKTFYRRQAWQYFSGMSITRNASTANTNIATLEAYLDYFTTALLATDPYETYSFDTQDQLQALVNTNTTQQNTLANAVSAGSLSNTVVQYFARMQYGSNGTGAVDTWATECASAMTYFANKDKVDWLMANIATLDADRLNALDYTYAEVNDDLRTVLSTGTDYYNYMEQTVKTSYVTAYERYVSVDGYNAATVQTKLAALKYYIDCYDLAALKVEIDAYIAQYPTSGMEAMTDAAVVDVYTQMSAYVTAINAYTDAVIDAVFTEGTGYVADFREAYRVEMVGREAEAALAPYVTYFTPLINQANNGQLYLYSTANIRDTLIPEGQQQYSDYQSVYAQYEAQLPEGYLSQFADFGEEIAAYLEALPARLATVLTNEVETAINAAGGWDVVSSGSVVVDLANFTMIKSAVNAVEDDVYEYLNTNYSSLLTQDLRTKYAKLENLLVLVEQFEDRFLDEFQHVEYDAENGYYTVRYGGLAGDIARTEGEDYTVTNTALETLINKLDTFLGSSDFTDLMAQLMENGNIEDSIFTDDEGNVMTLNEFVWSMLNENLFNDETVTMIMQAFYPMIYDTIMTMIPELIADLNPLDLGSLGQDNLRGTLWMYLNGDRGSNYYEQLFEQLGLRITPTTLAQSSLIANYPAVRAALQQGADSDYTDLNDWDEVDWESMTWGVTDYESFVDAMAACLDGITPLLRTLLANAPLNATVNNAAYADVSLEYKVLFWIPYNLTGWASANLSISGYTGFQDLVIPIYEALGLTDYDFTIPDASSSTAEILDCVLSPILALVDQITANPLNTLLEILPNLTYGLVADKLTDLVNQITLNLNVGLDVDVDSGSLGETITQWIVDLVKDSLKISQSLNIGDLLGGSLASMLPFNYTDLNAMIDYILSEAAGINLDLPLLNASDLITAADLDRNASSQRTSGTRINFTTDKADLFWVLWDYIANAVGDEEFMGQLFNMIDPELELPEIVDEILATISTQPDQALAAVTELLVPQTYDMQPYNWYTNDDALTDGIAAGDFSYAYLYYTNDWDEAAALGVVDNLEAVLNDALAGTTDGKTVGEWLNDMLNSLFTNNNLTALVKALAENLGAAGVGAIGNLIRNQFDVDMGIWTAQYADLFGLEMPAFSDVTFVRAEAQLGGLVGEMQADGSVVWTLNGTTLVDGDRDLFVEALLVVLDELAPILNRILLGEDISLFNGAIEVLGYDTYDAAILPLVEALGVDDALTQEEYAAQFGLDAAGGLHYIVNTLFQKIDDWTAEDMVGQILDVAPGLLYFLQSGGLSSAVLNLVKPIAVLLDTIRPIYNLDINALLQDVIDETAAGMNEDYDPEDETRFMIDVRDLDMNAVYALVEAFTGIEVSDVLSYALEGLFYYSGIVTEESKSVFLNNQRQTISFSGSQHQGAAPEDAIRYTRADTLTVLLSLVLDLVKYPGNAEKIDALIGEDSNIMQTIVTLLNYENPDLVVQEPDWFYMVEFDPDAENLADFIASSRDYSGDTISYLRYAYEAEGNLWTESSADFLSKNIVKIIDMIVEAERGADLNTVLANEFANGKLYSEYNLQKLGYMLGDLLNQVPESYLNIIGVVVDVDLDYYKQFTVDPDESLKDVILSNEEFAARLADMLEPVAPLLDWLLFGKDYKFFYGKDGSDAIVLAGTEGYTTGLAPILEALQITAPNPADYEQPGVATMAEDVFLAIMAKIDEICNAGDGEAALQVMLNHLPNLIYFMNAGGVTAAVNNLLMSVNALVEAAAPLTGMDGNLTDLINDLIADSGITLDLNEISFATVGDIVKDLVGLNVQDAVSVTINDENGNPVEYNYLGDLFVGELVENTETVTGMRYFRAMPTADGTTQRDVLTVILCAALDVLQYPENKDTVVGWFGENVYEGIMNLFAMTGDGAYQDVNWLYTDGNGNILDEYKDKVFSPLKDNDGTFNYGYDEYWTREKATYVADNLNDFVNGLIKLLGVQIDGVNLEDIGDIIEQLIGENLYTNANAASLAKTVADLVAQFSDYEDGIITDALKEVLDVDLTVYEKYAGGDYDFGIETGNKEQFTDAIVELLMPIAPILKVVLTGEDLSLLVDKEGNNAITVYGAEGYKYAVIPVLEALDRDNPNIKTAEEYYADIENDPEALIRDILVPVFDFLDYVLEDPMNNLLASMPSLVYFINSKGLDTAFKNIVRPVTDVLTAIEPITGPVNLYDVIGIDLATVDFEYLFNMLVDMLGEGLGEELVPAVGNAISDMTMGKLVTFTSKNGKQAVTMEYVEGDANLAGSADMLTIILRFALKWITMPENQETVKSLITQYIPDAEAAEYVIGTYETLVSYLNKDHGINMMLGVLYYIFYGLDIAVDETNDWFDDVNGKWKFIMDLFDQAESDYLINFGDALDKLFGITDDVIDEDGIASSGLVPFFQKIINFFKTIIEWLRSLFGLN